MGSTFQWATGSNRSANLAHSRPVSPSSAAAAKVRRTVNRGVSVISPVASAMATAAKLCALIDGVRRDAPGPAVTLLKTFLPGAAFGRGRGSAADCKQTPAPSRPRASAACRRLPPHPCDRDAAPFTGGGHIDGPIPGQHCGRLPMLFFRPPCGPILRSAGASRLWQ
jgi:hypothetical protein